jgi:plastocyanin
VTPSTKSGAGSALWGRRHLLAVLSLAAFARPAKAANAIVEIRQFKFAPADVEVAAGDTVTFVNLDLVPHTATGDSFDTGTLKKGARKDIAFPAAGEFRYLCKLHRHMKGRILVR